MPNDTVSEQFSQHWLCNNYTPNEKSTTFANYVTLDDTETIAFVEI
jgi:hypothetical protein